MFERYFPSAYAKSVFHIDYKRLYALGIRGIIFDIDNTLVHHGDDATEEIISLFREITTCGLKCVLLSDNSESRVSPFAEKVGSPYVFDAGKPDPSGYEKAVSLLGTGKDETISIGDQMFVDIVGANRFGVPSILVHYVKLPGLRWPGFKRIAERCLLVVFRLSGAGRNRYASAIKESVMADKSKRVLFCEMNPFFYVISQKKNIMVRHIKNLISREKQAKDMDTEPFPCLISSHSSHLIKRGKGIDPVTQHNKAHNIRLACRSINGLIIHPGETFSFWIRVGDTTVRRGYREGRVLINGRLTTGLGGGLCNLANTINRAVLLSPLTVTEFHRHSDALAPDEGERLPLSTGTSVNYNYIDYRFRNDTPQDMQLLVWCDDDNLYSEVRSRKEFKYSYGLSEEDHHFTKEGDKYYRVSRVYRDTYDRESGKLIKHKLLYNNHSEVFFDPEQIPKELIR
ncbi:MAG: VanW family protein [Lachnospiraceae bacterium]|nr:VanW family protein [Lachnospiraceae bacterium]